MPLGVAAILEAVRSHIAATGRFERVLLHEAKSAPGNGLTAAVWVESMVPTISGLVATCTRVEFHVRVMANMLQEPQDAIDAGMLGAVDRVMEVITADFTLGGLARNVDLLGEDGEPFSMVAGYIEQDGKLFRTMDLVLPVRVDDLWTQAP